MTGTVERVKTVLMQVLRIPASALEYAARLDEIAPVDSLSLAELAAALDEEFGVELDGEGMTTGLSVSQIVTLVEEAQRRAVPKPG